MLPDPERDVLRPERSLHLPERRNRVRLSKLSPQPLEPTPKHTDSSVYRGRKSIFASLPRRQAALVFAGDSITDFCQWPELIPGTSFNRSAKSPVLRTSPAWAESNQSPALNRGISGDTIEGLTGRIGELLKDRPRQLFVMIGSNDFLGGRTRDQILAEFDLLFDQFETAPPDTQVFLQSVLPFDVALWSTFSGTAPMTEAAAGILQVNSALAKRVDGKRIVYVDVYSKVVGAANQLDRQYTADGVHLNGHGCLKWRDVISPLIVQP